MEPCVAVAYSGGRDSTALLHATLTACKRMHLAVVALHVHHGLSAHADEWLAHCQRQCKAWARRGLPVKFAAFRLSTRPARGQSVEAWARRERYRALGRMAREQGASVVLLAHHRRDQAETFVLQALRGAGVNGLAGMPVSVVRDGLTWLRPWLNKSPETVAAYLRRHRLEHIEDESNNDMRFARNRLRLQVWPGLIGAFDQAEAALADSANWARDAAQCLDEVAVLDLGRICGPAGLDVRSWRGLSRPRRNNALRAWLKLQTGAAAPASLLIRLQTELAPDRSARWPVRGGELRSYRGTLRFTAGKGETAPSLPRETVLHVRRAGMRVLPGWGGRLQVKRVTQGGVPLAWLAQLELRPRMGGERFQSGIDRPPRSLKKQYQAAAIPSWEREGPLLYSGGQLVYVPGLGIDARVVAIPGQVQVNLRWVSSSTPPS
jgi:tRNA(Ile)-lysidine synthase